MLTRVARDDGMTLVELLAALLVLGIAMAALAGLMVTNVRSVANSQSSQAATNASLELVESMHAQSWDTTLLYALDATTADARWRDRLDPGGTFDGLELVTTPGPTSEADRDPSIPLPTRTLVTDDVTFTLDLYPVWVDRSGDGAVETKRFVVVATWEDPVLGERELRTEAERAPRQSEAASSSSGARFIQASADPDPVTVDHEGGTIDGRVTIRARTNVGVAGAVTATLSWREPQLDAAGALAGFAEVTHVLTLGNGAFVDGQGYVTFEGDFNGRRPDAAGGGRYRFANGVVEVSLAADSHLGEAMGGVTSFRVTGSPWDDDGSPAVPEPDPSPDPDESPDPSPTPDPSPDPHGYDGDPNVRTIVVGQICVSSNKWELTQPLTFTITIEEVAPQVGDDPGDPGYEAADATVTVIYPYWTKKSGNAGAPDGVDAIAATFSSGTQEVSTWEAAVPANGAALFKPGENVTFDVTVTRSSDAANDTRTTSAKLVQTC